MSSEVIQSRADFHRVLSVAVRQLSDRMRKTPRFAPYENIELQLDAMRRWTADGRTPTEDERQSIDIGLIAVRELEPADTDEDEEFITNLHELNFYFENWPDDPNVAATTPSYE
jgi:hypothetical protein